MLQIIGAILLSICTFVMRILHVLFKLLPSLWMVLAPAVMFVARIMSYILVSTGKLFAK